MSDCILFFQTAYILVWRKFGNVSIDVGENQIIFNIYAIFWQLDLRSLRSSFVYVEAQIHVTFFFSFKKKCNETNVIAIELMFAYTMKMT